MCPCHFNPPLPDDGWWRIVFHVSVGHRCVFSGKTRLLRSSAHFFIELFVVVVVSFLNCISSLFIYFGYSFLTRYVVFKYLLQFTRRPSHFVGRSFTGQQLFPLMLSHCLFLLLRLLPLEADPRTYCEDDVKELTACFLLEIFWFGVL